MGEQPLTALTVRATIGGMSRLTCSRGAVRRLQLATAARRVREVCADASSTEELIDGLRPHFNEALGLSGMLLGSTDPLTAAISTATRVEHLPDSMALPWMRNEALEQDFNKFSDLHRSASNPLTLHRSTQGNPQVSARYRLNVRMGLGPEMRVTFSAGGGCWGVASFARESGDADFDEDALDWIDGLRGDVASGLRRVMVFDAPRRAESAPGVVTLDSEGVVQSMTVEAKGLLGDLWMCNVEGLEHSVPGEAYMVATIARAHGLGLVPDHAAKTRLRGRSGQWLTIRGDCMFDTDGAPSGVVLMIEHSRPVDMVPLMIASFGLTAREREVLAEMTNGQTAGEIAGRLFISEHTVRDHFKAIFAKTGTGSRGELMSLLFQHGA